jgi:integrase
LAGYEATVRLHIIPQLGNDSIGKLTTASISEFAQSKLQNGRADGDGGLSPKTVRDILSVLKGIMEFAVSERILENAVIITYPKHKQKTMRVLSHSEQSILKDALLEDTTIYKAGILLCLYTGIRVGEVCALRWQDFSPNFDKLSVCQSMRRIKNKEDDNSSKTKIITDTPKSKSSLRDVPIPKFLSPILRDFVRDKDTYFLSTGDILLTEPRIMQSHFKRVIKTANISDANFHSLRHTFSTRCIEANVDIKSLSEMLGHASVNITLNRYVHSSFEQKREGMNKLEQYLGL